MVEAHGERSVDGAARRGRTEVQPVGRTVAVVEDVVDASLQAAAAAQLVGGSQAPELIAAAVAVFNDGGDGVALLRRLDQRAAEYKAMAEWIDGFRKVIDEDNSRVICYSAQKLMNREPNEAPAWLADAMMDMRSDFYTGKLDGAVINKGGIRHPIPEGAISEGFLKSLLPFYNNFEVIKLSGKDLKEALKVMAFRGGDGLSREFHVEHDADFNIIKATLNGKPIKEKKQLRL